jgi:hypothetical protein
MVIRKAYRFRLKSSPVDEQFMRPFAGHNRFVWNHALALQKDMLNSAPTAAMYVRRTGLLRQCSTVRSAGTRKTRIPMPPRIF